jgi:hypothetical protein
LSETVGPTGPLIKIRYNCSFWGVALRHKVYVGPLTRRSICPPIRLGGSFFKIAVSAIIRPMQAGTAPQTATENSSANLTVPDAPRSRLADLKGKPPSFDPDALLTRNFGDLADFYKKTCWSRDYIPTVSDIATQLGALDNEILASICIPVAGAQEMQKIYRCIQAFGYQTLSKERFEIALLVNYSAADYTDKHGEINQLFSEIDRAQRDFPALKVRTATLQFNSYEEISIGYLRSLLSDAVIERALRSSRADDLVMLRLDADTRAVKQQLIESHIRLYNSRPNVLSIQGGLMWSPEGLANSPEQFVDLAYFSLQHTVERHRDLIASWSGPAGSIRGSAYCWIGGYDPGCHLAEDRDLTKRLFISTPLDNQLDAVVPGGPATNVVTSNRRAVLALEHNVPVSSQWETGSTQFRAEDRSIRQRNEGNSCDQNNPPSNAGLKEVEVRLAREEVKVSAEKSGADHDYLKAKQILAREGLLARLYETYAVEGHLVNRLLCDLPQDVANFRGDGPDRLSDIRDSSFREEIIRDRLERYWWPFLEWPSKIGLAVQKSVKRSKLPKMLKRQIRMDINLGVLPEITPDLTEKTFLAALTESQALRIHVTLPHTWGKVTIALRRDRSPFADLVASVEYHPRKTSKEGDSNKNNLDRHILETFSTSIEEQLATKNPLYFQSSRLIADRLVAGIVTSLEQLELELGAARPSTAAMLFTTLGNFSQRMRSALNRPRS